MQFYFGDFISNLLGLVIILTFLMLVFYYPMTRKVIGLILTALGLVFSVTTIGELIGIPAVILGLTLVVWPSPKKEEE